jgi:DnaJ-class molecular chaperone
MTDDLYTCLGLNSSVSRHTIRRAYNHLAKLSHPDKTGSVDTSLFQIIQSAYETLSDPVRRRAYDLSRQSSPPQTLILELSLSQTVFGTSVILPNGLVVIIPPKTLSGEIVEIDGGKIQIRVLEDSCFRFHKGQLWTRRCISLWEALVGFRLHFKTLSGARTIIVSEQNRIYLPGDIVTILDKESISTNIELQIQFPTTISRQLCQTITSEKHLPN